MRSIARTRADTEGKRRAGSPNRSPPARTIPSAALLLALIALGDAPAAGQQRLADHPHVAEAITLLDAWLDAELAYERIPGLSVGVVHGQELVWATSYGYAHVVARVPATPRTLYKACSVVKPFTAMAVLQLRDRGLLDLQDRVSAHLPWFAVENSFPEAATEITIETLLTHSSGLPRDLPYPYWTGPEYPFPAREAMVDDVRTLSMTHPADTRYGYSNVGMSLAGEVVVAVSGVPYDGYLQRQIFAPIGMNDTHIDPAEEALEGRLAAGYTVLQRDGGRLKVPPYRVGALAPAAGLVSSVEDMARFASWQFRALEEEADVVMRRSTLRAMHQVQWMQSDGWGRSGYGYQTWAENDRHFVGHAGACPGYESKLLMRPTERVAVILMTNAQGPDVDGYAQRIYDLLSPALGSAAAAAGDWRASPPPRSAAGRFAGRYQTPYGGEAVVVEWKGGLALLRLPSDNPLRSMEVFEPAGEGVFRREGTSGPSPDLIRFERDPGGQLRMWRQHQYAVRVE